MAELGILVVGPDACGLPLPMTAAPILRVRSEALFPSASDVVLVTEETGKVLFDGPDADRWRLVPQRSLLHHTEMLWATSQVSSLDPERTTDGWRRILVIADAREAALLPVLRSFDPKRPCTILLCGGHAETDPEVRRNHVALAEMLRTGRIRGVIYASDPAAVLAVVLDAARNPAQPTMPPRRAVDIGPFLDLPAVFAMPAAPVDLARLVHVPIGRADHLPWLVADLAAFDALQVIVDGPPMEVDGVGPMDLTELRSYLPEDEIFEGVRQRIIQGMRQVAFAGTEPLVEHIADAIRAVVPEVERLIRIANEIEAARILQLRAFGAAGVSFTTQRLRGLLDQIHSERPSVRPVDLIRLLEGDESPEGDPELAWRRSFAGLPAHIVPRGQPGAAVAQRMVKERYAQFTARFAAAVAQRLQVVVSNARNPQAHLPSEVLRSLYGRAVRVHDTLDTVRSELNARILARCEQALAADGLLRWLYPEPDDLLAGIRRVLPRLAVSGELMRSAQVILTNRPLGMADPVDFEAWMGELVGASTHLAQSARTLPSYSSCMHHLLESRDPRDIRLRFTEANGVDPVLFVAQDTDDDLLHWFERSGMRIELRAGPTSAIYWSTANDLSSPMAELGRDPMSEHLLEDLLLPGPEGDTAQSLAALVEASAVLLGGLVVGELSVSSDEGVNAVLVSGGGLPGLSVLPYGALHDLAVDGAVREALASRVNRRLDQLAALPDAAEAFQKLVELAELGPSRRLMAQTGLLHPRTRPLLPALQTLLQRYARRALVAMLDHLRAEEVRSLAEQPTRHALLDVRQLAPLGV